MKTNGTETVRSRKTATCKARKLPIYEALLALNQEFEKVLAALERLGHLSLFRPRLRQKFVRACRVAVEENRAWANFELIHILQAIEEKDWSRFGRLRSQFEDPDGAVGADPVKKKRQRASGKKRDPGRKAGGGRS
jgi:hypothetical protein